MAHITAQRRELNQISGSAASWRIWAILRDIATVMKAFLDHVLQQNLHPIVAVELKRLVGHVTAAHHSPHLAAPVPPQAPAANTTVLRNFQAKTEGSGPDPPSGGLFNMHGKTEP